MFVTGVSKASSVCVTLGVADCIAAGAWAEVLEVLRCASAKFKVLPSVLCVTDPGFDGLETAKGAYAFVDMIVHVAVNQCHETYWCAGSI